MSGAAGAGGGFGGFGGGFSMEDIFSQFGDISGVISAAEVIGPLRAAAVA